MQRGGFGCAAFFIFTQRCEMIPYGLLFYTVFWSDIEKYKGIWQDWLCMRVENGVEIEPWMMCLAENPIVYDTIFDTRLEREKKIFTDGRADFYFIAAGFAWEMFKKKNLSADDIYSVIDHYDEELGTDIYYCINRPEKKKNSEKRLEDKLQYARKYFNERIWSNIPKETQKLFQ